jgi:hypothetical protein
MRRTIVFVLAGAAVVGGLVQGGALAARAHGARTGGVSVSIRIEGSKRTLVPSNLVRPGSGWITRYGAPRGKCPRQSVQGALNRTTNGQWKGRWYGQYKEYFITSILGEKPSGHNYWEIFVNNRAASQGACDLKLQRGEEILFADTNGKRYPSALKVIHRYVNQSSGGVTFLVKLIGYNAHGTSKPLAGVSITGHGIQSATTNAHGQAKVADDHPGALLLRAAPKGYIRSETEVFAPSH